jgi:rare lipoprotein A
MHRRALIVMLIALAAFGGCAKKRARIKVPRIGATETGIASWYGHPYHGRRAANGEVYDMEKLTAAHRTLPFETWVRVRNLTNDRNVEVRITDRGPFIDGRIIDLSRAAAREIDLIRPGIAKVKLEVITPPRKSTMLSGRFAVQVGAFKDRRRAESIRAELERSIGTATLVRRESQPPLWRVLAGEEESIDAAAELAGQLRGEYETAFVVRLDEGASR